MEKLVTRLRTRGSLSAAASFPELAKDSNCSQTVWTPTGWSGYGIPLGTTETMSDVVVPNYHKRVSRGEVFFNPMRREVNAFSSSGGIGAQVQSTAVGCSASGKNQKLTIDTDVFQYYAAIQRGVAGQRLNVASLYSPSDINDLLVEVSTDLRNQRGRPRNGGNLAETAVEVDKTIGMIPDLANSMRKIIDKNSDKLTRAKGLAGAYLLYRYGMRPLVSDITNVALAIHKKTLRVRETSRSYLEDTRSRSSTMMTPGVAANRFVNIYDVDHIRCRAMSLDEYKSDQLFASGFSLKGLITLPYELIPLSFVADWFTNLGSWLGAYAPTPAFDQLGSCVVFDRTRTSNYHCGVTVANSGWSVLRPMTGSVTGVIHVKERLPLYEPGLVIRSDFGLRNLPRAVDALSLLVQRIKGLR